MTHQACPRRRDREHPGFPQAPGPAADRCGRSRGGPCRARDPDRCTAAGVQPKAVLRPAGTAVFAYLVALPLPVSPRPVLAPLTALLVVQVSLYQTLSSAVQRVAAVVAGVVLAVGLSAWIGFTWWSLGVAIVVALGIGYTLHLGDSILEVPISAMLILSVASVRERLPSGGSSRRSSERQPGWSPWLGLRFAPGGARRPRLSRMLCRKVSDLLDQMAAGVADGSVLDRSEDWLAQARALGGEIQRVDDALRQAEDSLLGSTLAAFGCRPLPLACAAGWRPWSMRRSRSASSPARLPTASGWPRTIARCTIPKRAIGSPACSRTLPQLCGRSAASRSLRACPPRSS